MREAELPGPNQSLTDWLNARVTSKADLTALSVSCQVLVTNLFEELEVMESQLTTIEIPKVKESIATLEIQLGEAKSQAIISGYKEDENSASTNLSECLGKINDLSRARTNLEAVKSRINEELEISS
jgi:hypothetical protein